MGKYDSRYNIDLDYTSIDENVFMNTMNSIGFNAYKRGNTKQIFCDYEDIEFNIIYKDKKSVIWIKSNASALASFLVDKKVLKYDDMYTKAGYFRDNPTVYNIICDHIVNLSCLGAAPAISRTGAHWSYSFLLHHFINYITIEYEKKLGIYKPSDTITIGLSEKLIKKLLSSDEERKKFFEYTKITDSVKNIFLNDLKEIPLTKRNSSSLFYPLTKVISNSNYSDYTFTLQSYFYNNGQDSQNIKKENKTKNNSSEKQGDTELKEDISQYLKTFNDTLNNCKEKILSVKNYSNDDALIEKCGLLENKIQEQLKNAEADLSKDIKNALDNLNDIVAETNKLYSEASNIKEKMDSIHQKCKDKLKEIRELSQDFEYGIKNDYYKDCDDIESRLNNCVDNKDEVNKIIDDINNLYRNAYNRKHNKSSLFYVMDIEEDDIDLLEHI